MRTREADDTESTRFEATRRLLFHRYCTLNPRPYTLHSFREVLNLDKNGLVTGFLALIRFSQGLINLHPLGRTDRGPKSSIFVRIGILNHPCSEGFDLKRDPESFDWNTSPDSNQVPAIPAAPPAPPVELTPAQIALVCTPSLLSLQVLEGP